MKLASPKNWGFWRSRRRSALGEDLPFEPAPASGLDALQMRLSHWGNLWSVENESAGTDAQQVVTARLTCWMQRCFGHRLPGALHGQGDPISLASSMPILTAFLGRRATRELSRRILRDI